MNDSKNKFDSLMMLDLAANRILDKIYNLKQELKKTVVEFLKKRPSEKWLPEEFDIQFEWQENGIVIGWEQKPLLGYGAVEDGISTYHGFRLTYKEVFGWEIDFSKPYPFSQAIALVSDTIKKS